MLVSVEQQSATHSWLKGAMFWRVLLLCLWAMVPVPVLGQGYTFVTRQVELQGTGRFPGELWQFDAQNLTKVAGPIVLGTEPRTMAASVDGRSLYVFSRNDWILTRLDLLSGDTEQRELVAWTRPQAIVVIGTRALVIGESNGSFEVFDGANGRSMDPAILRSEPIDVVLPLESGFALSPDGATAYVVRRSSIHVLDGIGSGAVREIDYRTPGIDFLPRDLRISPSGSRLYVAGSMDALIQVVDLETESIEASIAASSVGAGPLAGIELTADGRELLLATYHEVVVFDAETLTQVGRTISVSNVTGMSLGLDGSRLFVTTRSELRVFDIDTAAELATIEIGRGLTAALTLPVVGVPSRTPTITATATPTTAVASPTPTPFWTPVPSVSPCTRCAERWVPDEYGRIQQAIAVSADGDTVWVQPGTYVESLDFGGKDVRVRAVGGPAETRLVGAFSDAAVSMGPGGQLEGFTLVGSSSLQVRVQGEGSHIVGNVFDGGVALGFASTGAIEAQFASPRIEGNWFRGFHMALAVVSIQGESHPFLANNVFESNQAVALAIAAPSSFVTVVGNTFVRNRTAIAIESRDSSSLTLHYFLHNLLFDNEIGVRIQHALFGVAYPTWRHNLVFGGTAGYVGWVDRTGVDGNISADPQFATDLPGLYRLDAGSPAIDAGRGDAPSADDILGQPRVVDGDGDGVPRADLGAFEFLPTTRPTHTRTPTPRATATRTATPTSTAPSAFGPFPMGVDLHVDGRNAGPQDGSAHRPFATIAAAMTAARGSARVGVAPGTYAESVTFRRGVSLIGSGADVTVIEGGSRNHVVRCEVGARLIGFHLVSQADSEGRVIDCRYVENVRLEANRISCVGGKGIDVSNSAEVVITGNELHRGEAATSCGVGIYGVFASPRIERNRIEIDHPSSSSLAIELRGVGLERWMLEGNRLRGGVRIEGLSRGNIEPYDIANNLIEGSLRLIGMGEAGTIAHNTLLDGLRLEDGTSGAIVGNIARYFHSFQGTSPVVESVLRDNLAFASVDDRGTVADYEGFDPPPLGRNGNLAGAPLFVDPDARDFRLLCDSPAVDRVRTPPRLSTDIDGNRRPFDSRGRGLYRGDIGAFEFVAERPARDWWVPGDHATIQAALTQALPCDRVYVRPGRYAEALRFEGKNVALVAAAELGQVSLVGPGAIGVDIGPKGMLAGFVVETPHAAGATGVVVRGEGTAVVGNQFVQRQSEGERGRAAIRGTNAAPRVERNLFRDAVCAPRTGALVEFTGASRPELRNNVFDSNECCAVSSQGGWGVSVANNTFVDGVIAVCLRGASGAIGPLLTNNLFVGHEQALSWSSPVLNADFNLFFDNAVDVAGIGSSPIGGLGNVVADPNFRDREMGDLRLLPPSIAIDGGSPMSEVGIDFLGVARAVDGDSDGVAHVDRGAFEYVPPACPADCDRDGTVTPSEWTRSLGGPFSEVPSCSSDVDANGRVDAADLLAATRARVLGCALFQANEPSPAATGSR